MRDVVLYRKYRARTFSEIFGQDMIVNNLKNAVIKQTISHAYLFCGPRGTGKTSLARIMAKAVNCESFSQNNDVCNECKYCKSIDSGNPVDIIEMDAASNRGIDEVRQLKDNVSFLPNFLKYKIYIIDEVHMLTNEAFNALLKTLEEPPSHIFFILATTEPHKLPMTILSRVQRYDFRLANYEDVAKKLQSIVKKEGYDVETDALKHIFKRSGGSFRDAESLLGKVFLSVKKEEKINSKTVSKILGIVNEEEIEKLVKFLLNGEKLKSVELIRNFVQEGFSPQQIIDQSLDYIKEKLTGSEKRLANYVQIASLLIEAKRNIREFDDRIMILELEVCRIADFFNNGKEKIKRKEKVNYSQSKVVKEETKLKKDLDMKNEIDKQLFLQKISNFSPRLKAVLSYGEIKLKDNNFQILVSTVVDKTFIESPEIKVILKNSLDEMGFKIDSIIVDIAQEESKESEEEFDNASLVESILLS